MEHKLKDGMMDNRKVNDNHKGGIERVIQKKGDMEKGQSGKMEKTPKEKANWKRSGSDLTPRRA